MGCRKETIAEANHVDSEKVRCAKCYFSKKPDSFLGVVCTFWTGRKMRNDEFCSFWHDKKERQGGVKPTTRSKSMSEYIKREDVIDAVERVDDAYLKLKGAPMLGACTLLDEINDIPSANVIEVVRCKDCKYWLKNNHDKPLCTCIDRVTYGTDYCSYGEEQEHE